MEAPRACIDIVITDYSNLADSATPSTDPGTSITITAGDAVITVTAEGSSSGGTDRFVAATSNNPTASDLYNWFMANPNLRARLGINAFYDGGNTVRLESRYPGRVGNHVEALFASGTASSEAWVEGIYLKTPPWASLPPAFSKTTPTSHHWYFPAGSGVDVPQSRGFLAGGNDIPVNATASHAAATPLQLTGLTERLPVGMLVRDWHFIGEDFLRDGSSMLRATAGVAGTSGVIGPQTMGQPYSEVSGPGSFIGMSDGGINDWVAYDRVAEPLGSKVFRIHRGASIYSLDPLNVGGPVHWSSAMAQDTAVLKGAVLVGRAYLVRNYKEEAFTANDVTSWGDEIQMVVATSAVFGEGARSSAYELCGQISPTGYGKGYASADRYRLEGKPFVPGHSKAGPNPDVFLAPYPNVDPTDDPCP